MDSTHDYLAARRRRSLALREERRRAMRENVDVVAALEHASGSLTGRIEDASETGARFATSVPGPELAVGADVVLVLQPHGVIDQLRIPAIVVRVDAHVGADDAEVAYGLAFRADPDAAAETPMRD